MLQDYYKLLVITVICLNITAMEKALLYLDNRELPASWKREEMLGSDEDDADEEEDVSEIVTGTSSTNLDTSYITLSSV